MLLVLPLGRSALRPTLTGLVTPTGRCPEAPLCSYTLFLSPKASALSSKTPVQPERATFLAPSKTPAVIRLRPGLGRPLRPFTSPLGQEGPAGVTVTRWKRARLAAVTATEVA